ncbi:MAG: TraM recognition domain-containing protein [Pseudomonadota bacterium]
MIGWAKRQGRTPIDPGGARVAGLTEDTGEPVFFPSGHSLTIASNGAGKSTGIAVPAIASFACDPDSAILIFDGKEGELAAQCADMLTQMGRKVAVIDDMNVRPELARYKVALNPFGASVATFLKDPRDAVFANASLTETLIPEPKDDARNAYWRDWPRKFVAFAHGVMMKRQPEGATPGAAASILMDREMLAGFAEIEAVEGDPVLRAQAQAILDLRGHEHFPQHLEQAQKSLQFFAPGTRLADAGQNATTSHFDLIHDKTVIFLVGPQARMTRLSTYFALHINGFCDSLYAGAGPLRAICDEFTNMPLKQLVENLTTLRAYGGEFHMIVQSRSELIRKYGEQECETIEDNSIVKCWLGLSSFKEAERVSKAMGEEHAVATAMGMDSESLKANTNLSLIKQRILSPAELMAMPRGTMLVHVKGTGFFTLQMLFQNQIAPFCDRYADNPLEGGRLPSDPKIRLKLPEGG